MGRILAITGPTSGIGYNTILELAGDYDTILLFCRNLNKGERVKEIILGEYRDKNVDVIHCDLSDLSSVMKAATYVIQYYAHIDCLINNAGLVSLTRQKTIDGFELMFGTNYLGHFLLTHVLFNLIMESHDKQIIIVSSDAYKFSKLGNHSFEYPFKFNPIKSYGKSKLATLYFMQELHEVYSPLGLHVTAVHPGAVSTNLGKTKYNKRLGEVIYGMLDPFFITAKEGAKSSIKVSKDKELYKGCYVSVGKIKNIEKQGLNYYDRKRLIRETLNILQLKEFMHLSSEE